MFDSLGFAVSMQIHPYHPVQARLIKEVLTACHAQLLPVDPDELADRWFSRHNAAAANGPDNAADVPAGEPQDE